MTLRNATSADAELLAELNRHVHDLHVEAEPELYREHDAAAIAEVYRERFAAGDYCAIVAEADGEPVGSVSYQIRQLPAHAFCHARRAVYVDQLVVVPAARRTGVARQLMAAVEADARRRDIDRVELDVRAFNREAIDFYTTCGYAPVMLRLGRTV